MILFVCVENTFRSVMSEAIFNANAPKGWHAESAGVQPVETINPLAVQLLRQIGIEIGPKTPRLVSNELTTRAWRVITFACLDRCPIGGQGEDGGLANPRIHWKKHGRTARTPRRTPKQNLQPDQGNRGAQFLSSSQISQGLNIRPNNILKTMAPLLV